MRVLTKEEKRQLDKDLEWKLQRQKESVDELKELREKVDTNARELFQKYADYYNAARDYYYEKLDIKDRYRGGSRTMEGTAVVSDDYELCILGVWNSISLKVKKVHGGFLVTEGDLVTQHTVKTEYELQQRLIAELLSDHPLVRDTFDEVAQEKKRLREVRHKAGLE